MVSREGFLWPKRRIRPEFRPLVLADRTIRLAIEMVGTSTLPALTLENGQTVIVAVPDNEVEERVGDGTHDRRPARSVSAVSSAQ